MDVRHGRWPRSHRWRLPLGYGVTDAFDLEAKTAFFTGTSLVRGDAHYRVLTGPTSIALTAGGHKAIVRNGLDLTALDLAMQLDREVHPRLRIYAGPPFSYENLEGENGGFDRWYVVPGVKWGFVTVWTRSSPESAGRPIGVPSTSAPAVLARPARGVCRPHPAPG